MSREQAAALAAALRDGPLDLGGDLAVQRPLLDFLLTSHPLPVGVRLGHRTLGGIPVVDVDPGGPRSGGTLLFLHGGAYALGSAAGVAGMVAGVAGRAGLLGVSVDYRLAPEHPYPAALDDALRAYRGLLESGVPAHRVVVAGESAGGGLAVALLAALRDEGLPLPAAAFVFSPWADLTLTSPTLAERADRDPALTPAALATRAADYLAGAAADAPGPSPVGADLTGLPPLLVQCGSAEILLGDALRLAARAAECDVRVTLEVTPYAPHVFQGFPEALDEAVTAVDSAAAFCRARLDEAAG